ncbi:Helicase, C-terminal [Penicillium expansum]|uniref:Helicase, C-terminal n=1 Tax=Penicillium expansum TaxID=27334 RepID=A0A0A2K1D1_PENEN|nr:Helicase, C-terminal [Penicillium expansum]KGO58230.1 Helicase, C-terminal [Penicillium expansum]
MNWTRLEISLTGSEWKAMMQPDSLKTPNKNVEIAIFGVLEDAFLVGDCLSSHNLFLQDPGFAYDTLYKNPHKFPFTDFSDGDSDSDISEADDSETLPIHQASGKLSKSSLQYVLDNLHQHEYLHPVEPDEHLAISLFPHQKEAIDFMIRRETGQSTSSISLCKTQTDNNGEKYYRHAITGDSVLEPPVGPFGGILADTMGLGKTVTTLSTIVSTLNHAKEWTEKQTNDGSEKRRAKATLIVLPNEVLMDQWLNEIRNKFVPGTFAACRYHGASRKIQISTFMDYDIVLTTYGTIKVDFSEKKNLIFRTEFFRIVLDEEEMFSTKFRAFLRAILGHIPQEKGLVFSAWTKSLDIAAVMLRQHNIGFARVDGSMSAPQRQQAFKSFKTSKDVNILLMTIGTGAVGLNLSIATQVHILEPSWNPMVEQQAIGRVVRLGQQSPVVITRYIMKGTVEESVVSRQDFKLKVAMNGFERSSSDESSDDIGTESDAS